MSVNQKSIKNINSHLFVQNAEYFMQIQLELWIIADVKLVSIINVVIAFFSKNKTNNSMERIV